MAFGVDFDLDNSDDDIDSKVTTRRDDKDKENEIEGGGDINHMKESQEEESAEPEAGPGGLAGLIANLSGVIFLKFSLFMGFCNIMIQFLYVFTH